MITQTIRDVLQEWAAHDATMTPYNINDGYCDEFMADVVQRMGGYSGELSDDCTPEDLWGLYPGHVWIVYRGKHYDAECPEGVEDWINKSSNF